MSGGCERVVMLVNFKLASLVGRQPRSDRGLDPWRICFDLCLPNLGGYHTISWEIYNESFMMQDHKDQMKKIVDASFTLEINHTMAIV